MYAIEKNGGFKGRGVRETRREGSYGTEMVSSETITGAVLTARTTIGALLLFAPRISSEVEGAMDRGNVTVILCGFLPLPLTFVPELPLTIVPELLGLSCGFPGAGTVVL